MTGITDRERGPESRISNGSSRCLENNGSLCLLKPSVASDFRKDLWLQPFPRRVAAFFLMESNSSASRRERRS